MFNLQLFLVVIFSLHYAIPRFICFGNLVPRVLRLFGQRLVARRETGVLEFYYRRICAVKQCKPLQAANQKINFFFEFSRVSPGDQPLAKEPEDSGYEIVVLSFGFLHPRLEYLLILDRCYGDYLPWASGFQN